MTYSVENTTVNPAFPSTLYGYGVLLGFLCELTVFATVVAISLADRSALHTLGMQGVVLNQGRTDLSH